MQDFMKWMFTMRGEQTPLGDLARDAFLDPDWDGKLKTLERITAGTIAEDSFLAAVIAFRKQRKRY